MWSNNLFIDAQDKVKIPQNRGCYFDISKSRRLKNTIEIRVAPYEEVDILNLYLVIKSYASNLIYPPSYFLISIRDPNQKEFIVYNSNIREFKNISYYGFEKWFYTRLHHDWQYLKKASEYFFMFTYPLNLFDASLISHIKPIYPWNSKILESFVVLKENEVFYMMTIDSQKEEIARQKEKIEELAAELESLKRK